MPKYINTDKLNLYDDLFRKGKNDSGVWVWYRDVENFIKDAPAADVQEVKHGHWYFTDYDYFDCSECGEAYYNGCNSSAEARKRLETGQDVYKYCPWCGAKMDGEK